MAAGGGETDPVAARRATLASVAAGGKGVGYTALAVACVAFLAGVLTDLPAWSVATVLAGLGLATLALVPAIILGYAVAKAEREDPGPQAARPALCEDDRVH